MPSEHAPPTWWEKFRDNAAPLLLILILGGLFNMYGTQRSILEVLRQLEKRIDRIEVRMDKVTRSPKGN